MTAPAPSLPDPASEVIVQRGVLRRTILYLPALALTAFAATLFGSVPLLPFGAEAVSGAGLYLIFELPLAAATLALTLLFWRVFDRLPASHWGFHLPTARNGALAVVVALIPVLGGLGLDLACGHARVVGVGPGGPAMMAGQLALYAALGLTIGLAEETPFRGYLLPNLTRRLGAPVAIVSTSVLFAALHLVDPEHRKLLNVVELTLAGVGFALLRLGTGSLTIPILAHACYDFSLFTTGTERDFHGVLRTEIGPYNLWLGSEHASGLAGILILVVWVAALWRWIYLPCCASDPALERSQKLPEN